MVFCTADDEVSMAQRHNGMESELENISPPKLYEFGTSGLIKFE